jgi:hypothetical protein
MATSTSWEASCTPVSTTSSSQAAYNRRLRRAAPLVAAISQALAVACPSWCDAWRLLDATPVPCGASRQTVRRSDLAGWAGYGYDRSHSRWYWGLKLYVLACPDGLPVAWCLANPAIGERQVAASLLDQGPPAGRRCGPAWSCSTALGWPLRADLTEERPAGVADPVPQGRVRFVSSFPTTLVGK